MIDTTQNKVLQRKFYIRPVITVAKELLGKVLVKKDGNKVLAARIVEVEAFDGKVDQASHAFKGKTKRNEVMFNEGGYLICLFYLWCSFLC